MAGAAVAGSIMHATVASVGVWWGKRREGADGN
jgi:hypothetical protein